LNSQSIFFFFFNIIEKNIKFFYFTLILIEKIYNNLIRLTEDLLNRNDEESSIIVKDILFLRISPLLVLRVNIYEIK